MMNNTLEDSFCENAFSERFVLSSKQSMTIGILLSVLSPTTAITNIVLCLALVKTKQIKNHSQRFIIILGISDFCVGAISMPMLAVVFTVYRTERVCAYEKVSLFFGHFNTRLTAYVIFLIGIDRYFNINPKLQSKSRLNRLVESETGYRVLITAVIVICAIQGSMTVIDFEDRRLPDNLSSVLDLGVYTTYLFIYTRLYFKVRRFSKSNSTHTAQQNHIRPRYIKNLVKTVLYLLVSVGLCYSPYVVMRLVLMYKTYREKGEISPNLRFLHYLAFQPIIANSLFNAMIILNRNSVLKRFIVKTLLRRHAEVDTINGEGMSMKRNNSFALTPERKTPSLLTVAEGGNGAQTQAGVGVELSTPHLHKNRRHNCVATDNKTNNSRLFLPAKSTRVRFYLKGKTSSEFSAPNRAITNIAEEHWY
eukprot:gene9261-10239_t